MFALACGPSKQQYDAALTESKAVAAEKDSLLTEVLETSKFVAEVNNELARASTSGLTTPAEQGTLTAEQGRAERAAALEKVKELVARLTETEDKLTKSSARAKGFSKQNAALVAQIEDFKKTIDDLRTAAETQIAALTATVDSQRVQIATLGSQLDTAQTVNTQLVAQTTALTDTVSQLTTYKNTVYFVAGTEDELLAKGIITKEGKKFLFFGGHHLEPARTLSTTAFTAVDKTNATEIMLPHPDREYKVVSRQSLQFADSTGVRDGRVEGQLRIASPEDFWAPSKYLILVED
jgi:archaellum component FlaC